MHTFQTPTARFTTAIMTAHATARQNERCIPQAVIDLLLDFAEPQPAYGGCERYAFSKQTWRDAANYLGPVARFYERYRSAYVVACGGVVITVAWRH